ncbi:DNA helicase [Tanacetum coccineum]
MQCHMTGDHVEIIGTSSGVQQKAKTLVEKDVHRGRFEVPAESIRDVGFCKNVRRCLLPTFLSVFANASGLPTSIDPPTEPADTNENCSLPNRYCNPILTVFERFRNLPTANVKSDSMSRLDTHLIELLLGVGKRFLYDMVSPCMPADRFEPFSAVAESISIKQNAMTCVAPSEEHAAEVSLRFRNACDDDFWSFEFGIPKNRDNHGVQYPTLTDTSENIVRRLLLTTLNHAYLCVYTKDCTIRPAISPLVTRAEEALSSRTVNIGRKRKNTSSLLALHPEDTLFTRSIRRRYTPATSNIFRANTNRNSPVTNIQNLSVNMAHARNDTPSYMDLGDCDQQCRHCGCLFWYNERLKDSYYTKEAKYHLCCGGGQIYMPPIPDPPAFIQQLFKNNQFMEHIRAYNQMFAMTSFVAKIDHSVNKRRGPYVFKISGQIYHWIGSLCPEEGHHPHFLQLYVYNTRDELCNRMHHFGGLDESILNPEIVEGLIHVLDEHNGLVRLFRTARDIYNACDILSFKIRLYNMGGVRGYELSTADVLGAIVFENGPRSRTDFDVIIEFKGRPPQRINKLHQSYMSLQFPLLFVFGLYDAVSRGEREGISAGSKIMLLNTFTRGPRVFEQKVKDFLRFLKEVKTFGYIFAVLYTIEFQKRGLPHCHTLLWIESRNTLKDATQIDEYISAEIPDPVQDPRGYKLVTELMMHGPCGSANLDASCMQNGPCNKHFPKQYNEQTYFDSNGHTQYRRRDTGIHVMKGESRLDNCNVVPYNRALCLAFEAHINVEYCGWRDLFYFRMLLCHQKGCKSPDEVRTVNGQMLPTFRAACEALGLLGDDKIALEESTTSATSKEIIVLFAQILIYCDVADLVKLWAKHWEAMQDDISAKISKATGIQNYHVNNAELQGYILYELEKNTKWFWEICDRLWVAISSKAST